MGRPRRVKQQKRGVIRRAKMRKLPIIAILASLFVGVAVGYSSWTSHSIPPTITNPSDCHVANNCGTNPPTPTPTQAYVYATGITNSTGFQIQFHGTINRVVISNSAGDIYYSNQTMVQPGSNWARYDIRTMTLTGHSFTFVSGQSYTLKVQDCCTVQPFTVIAP